MKILYIGDLHCGIKKDDPWFEQIILDLIIQAVEYSVANGIKAWIQTGDWFDVRKAVSHRTMEFIRLEIIPRLKEADIKCYVDVGNHDLHNKHKMQPNAPRELLAKYDCFHVIDEPETVYFDNVAIDVIPWMCNENITEILEFIKNSASPYCVGHFELNGFAYYKNVKSTGYEPDFLKSYKRVISGHFHTQSSGGNVQYIGTPYTITAGDENEQRGFWEHDLSTDTMLFIPNKKMHHVRLNYPGDIDTGLYENCSVRLIVTDVDKKLSKVEESLSKITHELKIVNKAIMLVESNTQQEEFVVQSVQQMIEEQIRNSSLDASDKEATLKLARTLYTEAVNMK